MTFLWLGLKCKILIFALSRPFILVVPISSILPVQFLFNVETRWRIRYTCVIVLGYFVCNLVCILLLELSFFSREDLREPRSRSIFCHEDLEILRFI